MLRSRLASPGLLVAAVAVGVLYEPATTQNYYRFLQVPVTSSHQEVTGAYRRCGTERDERARRFILVRMSAQNVEDPTPGQESKPNGSG